MQERKWSRLDAFMENDENPLELTGTQKMFLLRDFLDSLSDEDLATLCDDDRTAAILGRRRNVPDEVGWLLLRDSDLTLGEFILTGMRNADVLKLPVRGRRLRDWLPPSYDGHVHTLRNSHHVHVKELCRHPRLRDGSLATKIAVVKRDYEQAQAREAARVADDDARVATLLLEAQWNMLERPIASLATLASLSKPPTTRAERIETLMHGFAIIVGVKPKRAPEWAVLQKPKRAPEWAVLH
jgi:hypothetical protein